MNKKSHQIPTHEEVFQKILQYDGSEKPYDWLPESPPDEPLSWYEALPPEIQEYTGDSPWFYMELKYRIINKTKRAL